MNSVLIIDDDKELCTLMKKCVEQENLSAVMAHDGLEGLRLLEENKDTCSLIILDVMMPDMDGFQVLQKIREKNNVPVLMLTAKSDEEDKVSGLRLGADDYLTKPFSINELMARINSLIRRYTTLNPVAGNEAATMLLKDMVVDKINRTVTVQNRPVELTGKEFDLLLFLASNKGRVFTKNRSTLRYGRRNMPLTTATSCPLSANYGRKSSQIQNSRFTSRRSEVWGIGSIRRHEHGDEPLPGAGLVDCFVSDRLPFGKTSPRARPAIPYQRCPDGYKEREPEPPCTGAGKRPDKSNLL